MPAKQAKTKSSILKFFSFFKVRHLLVKRNREHVHSKNGSNKPEDAAPWVDTLVNRNDNN